MAERLKSALPPPFFAMLIFGAALALRAARPAQAEPAGPRHVALLAATPDDVLAGRIEAELGLLGFDVQRFLPPPDGNVEELARRQIGGGARAVVLTERRRTELWIADAGGGRVGMRQELEVDEGAGFQAVLAIRTVELLRMSVGLGTALPPVPVAGSPPVVARPSRREIEIGVGVSSGVLGSAGGMGPFGVLGAGVRVLPWPRWGFELRGYAPLTSSEVTNAGSVASTAVWLACGGLLWRFPAGEARITGEGGVGAMAVVVRATGSPSPPEEGGNAHGTGAAVYGRLTGRLRLGGSWALPLELLAGGAVRRPIVQFGSRDVASWGRAFAALVGGLELRF